LSVPMRRRSKTPGSNLPTPRYDHRSMA
jgi:hypothetical protein